MKSVIETLQSYFGLFCEDRKPRNNKHKGCVAGDGGHGGYGFKFSLLNKRAKPKVKESVDGDKLSRKLSSSRVHSLVSISKMVGSEVSILPPPPPPPSRSIVERNKTPKSSGLKGCLGKMYDRRGKPWKPHVDSSFDKRTAEYYARSKKLGLNTRRLGSDFGEKIGNVDGVDEDNNLHFSDTDEGLDSPKEVRACNEAGTSQRQLPHEQESNGEPDFSSLGSSSKQRQNEHESNGGPASFAFGSLRMQHKRSFPPPLTSLAMQSYCDRRGQSPPSTTCSTTHCLRSLRKDGRFLLEEVKAPIQKYFKVLREDGRLKLELVELMGDSSQEEGESYASDMCAGRMKTGIVRARVSNDVLVPERSSCVGLCIGGGGTVDIMKGKAEVERDGKSTSELVGLNMEVLEPPKCMEQQLDAKPMPTFDVIFSTGVASGNVDGPPPGRTSMRALHSGPSSTVRSAWAHAISAF